MQLCRLSAVIYVFLSVHLLVAEAYPTLALPLWSSSGSSLALDKRHKKTGTFGAQSDADVLELENLRQSEHNGHSDMEHVESAPPAEVAALPELERRLELASDGSATTPSAPAPAPSNIEPSAANKGEVEKPVGLESELHAIHRPPTLQTHDGGKIGQQHADEVAATNVAAPLAPTMTKPFYGAARLAFGQNPEVLPTTTTTTTTTSTTTTTTAATTTEPPTPTPAPTPPPTTTTATVINTPVATLADDVRKTAATDLVIAAPLEHAAGAAITIEMATSATNTAAGDIDYQQQQQQQQQLIAATMSDDGKERDRNVEAIPTGEIGGDLEVDAIKALPSRRSAAATSNRLTASPKTMAQYVFWTGDEVGVARAVEEFIEQGLMTRESALKFLRDIRLAIDNLQRSYQDKMLMHVVQDNAVKKNLTPPMPPTAAPTTSTSTTTTTTSTTTTESPPAPETVKPMDLAQQWQRTAHRLLEPNKLSLPDLTNEIGQEELNQHGYSSGNGRVKISELLYAEYTLEEILYKLAKAMFTQSLSHGSDETQKELQKLTNFLEREGDLGVIPIDLQKKILNVLLTALSDTLREHPELLSAANVNLAKPYNRLYHNAVAAAGAAYEPIN